MQIKCGSEVSPCQKPPSLCQLLYPPLSYLSRLCNSKVNCSLPRSQTVNDLDTKSRNFSECSDQLPACDGSPEQQLLHRTMGKYSPSSDNRQINNPRRHLCSPVLRSDRYLKENIYLSRVVSYCHARLLHPAREALRHLQKLITNTRHSSLLGGGLGKFFSDAVTKDRGKHHTAFSDGLKVFPLSGSRTCCQNTF